MRAGDLHVNVHDYTTSRLIREAEYQAETEIKAASCVIRHAQPETAAMRRRRQEQTSA